MMSKEQVNDLKNRLKSNKTEREIISKLKVLRSVNSRVMDELFMDLVEYGVCQSHTDAKGVITRIHPMQEIKKPSQSGRL